MSLILYLEPVGGIAGDMFMAAAIDLGVEAPAIQRGLAGLQLSGWRLKVHRDQRHHIWGTRVDVEVDPAAHVHERSLRDIEQLIRGAQTLSSRVKERALEVFQLIGRAEAKVHQVPLEDIHFHEVGGVDSIVDVCAASLVLELLGEPQVFSAPPPMGSGVAKMAHGVVPIPPPATVEILSGLPVRFEGEGERTTPTGAALLRAFAKIQPPPELVLQKVGYGLGTKDWADRANVLRACLGEAVSPSQRAVQIEANLDDCSPQLLSRAVDRVLALGALDAWVLPATMKKGRPGHLLGVLCLAEAEAEVTQAIFSETTTLGVRKSWVERDVLDRRHEVVATPFGQVRMKLGLLRGKVVNTHPEYEDCLAVSEAAQVPLKVVLAAAVAAYGSLS